MSGTSPTIAILGGTGDLGGGLAKVAPLAGLCLAALSIGVGVLSFHYLENPARTWLNRRFCGE